MEEKTPALKVVVGATGAGVVGQEPGLTPWLVLRIGENGAAWVQVEERQTHSEWVKPKPPWTGDVPLKHMSLVPLRRGHVVDRERVQDAAQTVEHDVGALVFGEGSEAQGSTLHSRWRDALSGGGWDETGQDHRWTWNTGKGKAEKAAKHEVGGGEDEEPEPAAPAGKGSSAWTGRRVEKGTLTAMVVWGLLAGLGWEFAGRWSVEQEIAVAGLWQAMVPTREDAKRIRKHCLGRYEDAVNAVHNRVKEGKGKPMSTDVPAAKPVDVIKLARRDNNAQGWIDPETGEIRIRWNGRKEWVLYWTEPAGIRGCGT